MKLRFIFFLTAILLIIIQYSSNAQVDKWVEIINKTEVSVKYFSPLKSESFKVIQEKETKQNNLSIVKEFSDGILDVKLTFNNYDSHIELYGEESSLNNEDLCFTIKLIFPLDKSNQNVRWCYDLDSTETVGRGKELFSNYIDVNTVVPPDGAFNINANDNGGYGDNVGTGQMSFYPLAGVSTNNVGYGWGVDMGLPVVFRLAYEPALGMISEFDQALTSKTRKFPARAFFKLYFFEYDASWNMRAALKKYYQIQPEYFKRRVAKEGIWLPFTPLYSIKNYQDFGFAFHETTWNSRDFGLNREPTIKADKEGGIYSFQYTEPWDIQLPIKNINIKYEDLLSDSVIPNRDKEMIENSVTLDKDSLWQTRKLNTPWFKTGWAVSITTNANPDLTGYNRYDAVRKEEIDPAVKMDVDGIYFDSMEWNWHNDLDYNQKYFEYTNYPLTFSSSLTEPKPAIWNYASEYTMMNKIANEMHLKGKLTMGNGFGWMPFAPGILDLFGSEFSWYTDPDSTRRSLQYIRVISYQKPIVFLLNQGLDDDIFNKPPYDGYKKYFERMLFYGFFPSFFSVNSSSNPYWQDSVRYNIGRPFFKKYIPLIKEIAAAGWQPVTYAKLTNSNLKVERFGSKQDSIVYFTVFNPTEKTEKTSINIDTRNLDITKVQRIEEMIEARLLASKISTGSINITLKVDGNSTRLIKISKL